jgi:hypothetical protein
MMLSISDFLPPASPDATAAVFSLLAAIADPAAAKAALEKIATARADAESAIESAAAAKVTLDEARKAQDQSLAKERQDNDSSLAKSKSAFDADCARRIRDLDARDDAATQLLAKAKADAAEAAELRADLARRVAAIKSAVEN